MGEALAAWTASHPAYAGKCEETPCYGEPVTAEGSTTPQFSGVTTTGAPNDLVDGYRQALGTDVPEAVAKRNVLLFLPQDTHTTSFYVVHSSDGSCAFWNLKSATLGHLLAANPKTGDAQGAIGIELATENTELEPTWDPQNVGHAIVSIAPSTPGTAC